MLVKYKHSEELDGFRYAQAMEREGNVRMGKQEETGEMNWMRDETESYGMRWHLMQSTSNFQQFETI